jgi:uncharacterized protein (TIGR01732 family)
MYNVNAAPIMGANMNIPHAPNIAPIMGANIPYEPIAAPIMAAPVSYGCTAPAFGYGYPTGGCGTFVLIVVLFILLIIVGACTFYCQTDC